MEIERLYLNNFRCFGPEGVTIFLEQDVTAFVGGNGTGKTAVFQALSRLFGITPAQRSIRKQDFHVSPDIQELRSGTMLIIEVVFSFPELSCNHQNTDAIPAFFNHMAASGPGEPIKVRMRLQATWIDDGTSEGSIEEDLRWITTLDDQFDWDQCKRVQATERSSIQLIYVPAVRDASLQITNLLQGRLWRAAKWSEEFRTHSAKQVQDMQQLLEREEPASFVIERFSRRWQQIHAADTDTNLKLRLFEQRFEDLIRKVEFAFSPDEAGKERSLADLSDGQRSLFHIALTAATLEVERDIFALAGNNQTFDRNKLRRTYLTFLAIEEPENSLSPFFLARIIRMVREIGSFEAAQVALSSHSPAILSRIEPQAVRYFRLDRKRRQSSVQSINLPEDNVEAHQYVRLAVKAYPEIYFARCVILVEGDSERIIIPRLAEAMDVPLDPSFVPIVPLGSRYIDHFWRLLKNLGIPYVTLLDLDLGRQHGGSNLIRNILRQLIGMNNNDPASAINHNINLHDLNDDNLLKNGAHWLQAFQEESVFFSFPLDIDFAMLRAFPTAYQYPHDGGRGPRRDKQAVADKKKTTLKTGGKPDLYDSTYDEAFLWYPYLFLNRSKPETHFAALARISDHELVENAPPELKALIQRVDQLIG